MLGGRTNHWGRISLRMGPYDFKPKSRGGLGLDGPFDYQGCDYAMAKMKKGNVS